MNGNRLAYVTGMANQLLSDGVYNYTYDDEGNRVERELIATGAVTSYEWDSRNRLVSVTEGSKVIGYEYDVFNRRIAKLLNGVVTERYGYDGEDLMLVSDNAGQVTQRYLFGDAVDEVLAEKNATGMNWALADRQGSVKLVVDNLGSVVDRVSYDSFGNKVADGNNNYDFRFGFTGRELDPETNQYYYRARYYDSSVGRFISTDPIGLESGDTNLYRYVFNSPTQFTDPTGNMWDLGQAWNNFTSGVQNTWNTVSTTAQNIGSSIQSGLQNLGSSIQSGINTLGTSIGQAWNNAGSYIKEGFDAIGAATSAVIGTGGQVASWAWNKAGDALIETAFAADKLIAGFADVVSLGATTRIRESLYGDWVKEQHQGALFKTGQILGVGALVIISAGAGGLAAGGGAGARLAAAMVQNGVRVGLLGMKAGAVLGGVSSLAYDLDHGGLNGGSFSRALDGAFNGLMEGFKGGAKFGALAPLGIPGQILQTGMAFNDLKESAETTIGHLERGEYWSALVSAIGLVDSTKDAYHAGTKLGNNLKTQYGDRITNAWNNTSSKVADLHQTAIDTASDIWSNSKSKISDLRQSIAFEATNVVDSVINRFDRNVGGSLHTTRGVLGENLGRDSAERVIPGGNGQTIAGHGVLYHMDTTIVPEGTRLVVPRHGIKISDLTGRVLETIDLDALANAKTEKDLRRLLNRQLADLGSAGIITDQGFIPSSRRRQRVFEDLQGLRVIEAGREVQDYTIHHPGFGGEPLTIFSNSTTVTQNTRLSDILKPNSGTCGLATCTEQAY